MRCQEVHGRKGSGHFGVNKTLNRVRERFYWLRSRADVEDWCRRCAECASSKGSRTRSQGQMKRYNIGAPFERITIDVAGLKIVYEDLIIYQKDFPEAKKNDILEIYHPSPEEEPQKNKNKPDPEEEYPRLLLQIKSFGNDVLQSRETISVEQSIASAFGLQTYKNVNVRLVNPGEGSGCIGHRMKTKHHSECINLTYIIVLTLEDKYKSGIPNPMSMPPGNCVETPGFHNKDTHLNVPDDYSMPHWINLSFYSTNKKIAYSNFIPRIKLPPPLPDGKTKKDSPKSKLITEDEYIHNSFFDYDAYDAKIFQIPPAHHAAEPITAHRVPPRYKRSSGSLLDSQEVSKGQRRKMSDPDILHRVDSNARSEPIAIPPATCSPVLSPHVDEKELSPPPRMVVGSEGSPPLESRALINPFDPSHVTIKLTSNRRRWTHIFPKGPTGVLIQQHHYQAIPAQPDKQNVLNENLDRQISSCNSYHVKKPLVATAALQEYCKKRPNTHSTGHTTSVPPKSSTKSITLLWGATGEQEWTPALTTGVDWKSLTIPACLPITTDYFPDQRALNIDYVVSLYSLLPDSVNADFAQQRATYKKPLTTVEVFKELISQRLAQGFQLILMSDNNIDFNGLIMPNLKMRGTVIRKSPTENDQSYYLSIGRLFHKISLSGNTISVTRYRPRHPYPGFNYQYRYRFYAPWHDTYEESFASFTTEKLEHFNWNYLDHYVCTGGDTEFVLVDALKYWRSDHQQMVDGLIKFIETAVNKIKRSNVPKKPRMSLSILSLPPLAQPRRNSMSNFSQ
ncbi:hypothetical protein NQ317_004655, partial [Molorchus minor]